MTPLSLVWLDVLAEGGRLLVLLTSAEWWGCFVMITGLGRNPGSPPREVRGSSRGNPVRRRTGPGCGGEIEGGAGGRRFTAIRSLRRAPEEPDETCWLAGEGWWLSTAPAPKPL